MPDIDPSPARELLTRTPSSTGTTTCRGRCATHAAYDLDAYPLDVRQSATCTDLVRLAEGGVGAQFWSVFVPCNLGQRSVAATLEQIDFVLRFVAHYPDRCGWP